MIKRSNRLSCQIFFANRKALIIMNPTSSIGGYRSTPNYFEVIADYFLKSNHIAFATSYYWLSVKILSKELSSRIFVRELEFITTTHYPKKIFYLAAGTSCVLDIKEPQVAAGKITRHRGG